MLEMSALLIALTLFHRTSSFLLLFKKTDEVMNSAGVFAGHVAMGIMAGATDMFKTALASGTDTV